MLVRSVVVVRGERTADFGQRRNQTPFVTEKIIQGLKAANIGVHAIEGNPLKLSFLRTSLIIVQLSRESESSIVDYPKRSNIPILGYYVKKKQRPKHKVTEPIQNDGVWSSLTSTSQTPHN